MKYKTKFLMLFAVGCILLTAAFRFTLSYAIDTGAISTIVLTAVAYFVLLFAIGWLVGYKFYKSAYRSGIAFPMQLITFLVFSLISLAWFVWGNKSANEHLWHLYFPLIIWLPVLAFTYILHIRRKQNSINGIDKDSLFE